MFRKIAEKIKKKDVKGVITIFLCLIMVPILGISSALIEYARYQGDMQTTREIIDTSNSSLLAHYDKYVNERFGLLSIDQQASIDKLQKFYTNNNVKNLGKSITLNSVNAKAVYPLTYNNNSILQQQLNDYGETTVLLNGLLKDLNLEEILNKLDGIPNLNILSDVMDQYANMTSSFINVIKKAGVLKDKVGTYKGLVDEYKADVEDAESKTESLRKSLAKDKDININKKTGKIELKEKKDKKDDESDSEKNEEEELRSHLIEKHGKKLEKAVKAIFKTRKLLTNGDKNGKTIPSAAEDVVNAVGDFMGSFSEAKDSINLVKQLKLNSKSDSSGAFGEEINQFQSVTQNALRKISKPVANNIKKKINEFKDYLNKTFKVSSLFPSNYDSMTEENKVAFMELVSKNNAYDFEIIKAIGDTFSILKNISIWDALEAFKTAIVEKIKSIVSGITKTIMDAVKGLFDINIGYDGDLSAVLSNKIEKMTSAENKNNIYVAVLKAVGKVFTDYNNLKNKGNCLEKLGYLYDLCVDGVKAKNKVLEAIGDTIASIKNLPGNLGNLYGTSIMYGYAAYNFPNKNDYATGSALTGYRYSGIKYGKELGNRTPSLISSFKGLGDTINAFTSGSGSDEMFYGAEMEYLMAGTKSEVANQLVVFMKIYFLRMVFDLIPIFKDADLKSILPPEIISICIIYLLVIVGEPLIDTVIITNGESEPLLKGDIYLSPSGLKALAEDTAFAALKSSGVQGQIKTVKKLLSDDKKIKKEKEEGNTQNETGTDENGEKKEDDKGLELLPMSYQTHCLLSMMLSNKSQDVLNRISDLVFLESRSYYKALGRNYEKDKSFTAINSQTNVNFNPFMDVFSFKGSIFNNNIVLQRGY